MHSNIFLEKVYGMLSDSVKQLFQRRFMAAALGFLVTFMTHALRVNLGIAMVAMVNDTISSTSENKSNSSAECPVQEIYNSTRGKTHNGEFLWSTELQGYIQSAGYVGNVIFPIPGGILARKFGAKKMIIYAHLIAGFANLLSPVAARTHPYLLVVLTLLRGMAQAPKTPSVSVLSGKWFPRKERGFLSAVVYCGYCVGSLLTGIICGILCDLEFLGGWPLVFYVFGLLSVVVAALFWFFYYETPEEDLWISQGELDYIQKHQDVQTNNSNLQTPWFKIITSLRSNTLALTIFGQYWMPFYYLSVHPTYLGTILHFPIKENGEVTGLPLLAAVIAGWCTCFFSYWISNRTKIGVTSLRKGLNSLSCLVFGVGMIGIYLSKCNISLNVVFLYFAASVSGIMPGGSVITAPDISPTFCGPLTGYVTTLGSLSGVVVTVMVGYLTKEQQNLTQWGKIFLISAAVPLATGLMYQFFGSAEIQPWDPAYKKPTKKKEQELTKEQNSTAL